MHHVFNDSGISPGCVEQCILGNICLRFIGDNVSSKLFGSRSVACLQNLIKLQLCNAAVQCIYAMQSIVL